MVPTELLARRPAEVSGGKLQRVALARVLTVQPPLLFADEPTSRLDPASQQEAMAALLHAMEANGKALILVTHDDNITHSVGSKFHRFCEPI